MKKTSAHTAAQEHGKKASKARPIRLDDLLPEGDVRGGSGKTIVFGQRNGLVKK